jgi:hypothetical protein
MPAAGRMPTFSMPLHLPNMTAIASCMAARALPLTSWHRSTELWGATQSTMAARRDM